MKVIAHQAPGVDLPVGLLTGLAKCLQKKLAVFRGAEDGFAMVATVQEYVPGYHLRADPQYDHPRDIWRGQARINVPIEVRGRVDYLPEYAGNLDIITAAAARVGDMLVAHRLGISTGWLAADESIEPAGALA